MAHRITIAICDTTGSVGERYAYTAYGAPVFMTGAGTVQTSSPVGFETLYAGYRWDNPTPQMYYVRNRFLLPQVGTWNKRDPLVANGLDNNLYEAVSGRITNVTDSTGLSWRDSRVLSFCHGFFVQGPCNIASGCWDMGCEVANSGIDIVGIACNTNACDYRPRSNVAQALECGAVSTGRYYWETWANVCTFGVKGQVDTCIQLHRGEITCDEASARISSVGVCQLAGARMMQCQGGWYTRPIQNLPSELCTWGRSGFRPSGLPKNFELSPAACRRLWNDPAWSRCMSAAIDEPVRYGLPRCYEAAVCNGEVKVACSGAYPPQQPVGIGWSSPGFKTSCAMPRALVACSNPSVCSVTSGGIMVRPGCSTVFGNPARPTFIPRSVVAAVLCKLIQPSERFRRRR